MDKQPNIAYVIVNNLGGITSLIQNLILHNHDVSIKQELHVLNIDGNMNARAFFHDNIKKNIKYFDLKPRDNWYVVYKNLANRLNEGNGVLISNDQYDLIMLSAFNIDRHVIQIVHDEYNLSLSIKFQDCIDYFLTHSQFMYEALCKNMPQRLQDIQLIHYGIPITELATDRRIPSHSLKLVFLGRHVRDKGIFDLFEINRLLKKLEIDVSWTIIGKGPETEQVIIQWKQEANVDFIAPETHAELIDILSIQDILVFPTKFEGFPVALLESMCVGCVPVVSDIPGGIQEVVTDGETGFKCQLNNKEAFAEKIAYLYQNRNELQAMSKNASRLISTYFDIKRQSVLYQKYFYKIMNLDTVPRHHEIHKKIGSRLDHPLIPNLMTRLLRKYIC